MPSQPAHSADGKASSRGQLPKDPPRIRLLLADDHALMIEALRLALQDEPDLEIVGATERGAQVLALVEQLKPDMVVLDLRMPGMDGLTCIMRLRERFPQIRIVVLSAMDSQSAVAAALSFGANAFISKSVEPTSFAQALRLAATQTLQEPIGIASRRPSLPAKRAGLTEREVAILHALAEGHSNKEIAQGLWLATQTVKFHLTNIYSKLNVKSRTAAVHWAYEHGILDDWRSEVELPRRPSVPAVDRHPSLGG